ncbi:MAG: iron-containing alcohol dehydrogenase [bacterium]
MFGPGAAREIAPVTAGMGRRALVLTGSHPARHEQIISGLKQCGIETRIFAVAAEPDIALAEEGIRQARDFNSDVIVGLGGGSVIDMAKVVAAMLANDGALMDYLEVIGGGRRITRAPAPFIAAPTTAGTGSEVTRNAVIASPEHRIKVSMRDTLLLPRVAIVDPDLTHTNPPVLTASAGLDALTQLLEAFVCIRANPMTDGICREGLRRAARSLRRAYEAGSDAAAREDMALASMFSGLALANAGLGVVHAFAGPIGGMFPAPHGAVCGRMLPFAVEANIRALESRQQNPRALERYDEAARILCGSRDARASDAIARLRELCAALKTPALSAYGITIDDIPAIIDKARGSSSFKSNPAALTDVEMTTMLQQAVV